MDTPTGIDWSEWDFLNEEIITTIEANTAEIVVRQIMTDLKEENPAIRSFDGVAEIAFQLIEGTDTWAFFEIDKIGVDEEDTDHAAADAMISALNRLVARIVVARSASGAGG